ncbi:hypothetical protein [Halorhabdus sp. CBA1104]|uniref:hypothetical protein n=1 Tax=Halorhabdus sp. CBA1104 TaxID=1380432 RepID=UPI001E49D85C|nr:hypothetical protein [Halorhabdus sp. CBA1104]
MRTSSKRRLSILLAASLAAVLSAVPVSAHVEYVTGDEGTGNAAELFTAVFTDPGSLVLLTGGAIGALALVAGYLRFASVVPDIAVASKALQSYRPYLPGCSGCRSASRWWALALPATCSRRVSPSKPDSCRSRSASCCCSG